MDANACGEMDDAPAPLSRIILLVLSAVVLLSGCAMHRHVADDLSADIDRYGSGQALAHVYHDNDRWNALLRSIAGGSTASLDVAQQLLAVADAGAAEELELAAGYALVWNPAGVLRILDATPKRLVCGDVEKDAGPAAIRELTRRKRALMTVRDPSLLGPRDECIEGIDTAIQHRSR